MIETIKIKGNGYLVNGTLSVPKVDGNRHYEEVKEAIAGGTDDYPIAIEVEPEYTQGELDEIEARRLAKEAKEAKEKALNELIITHETVAYDADGRSLGSMGAITALASFKFNQAISIGLVLNPLTPTIRTVLSPVEAYNTLYKNYKVWWKGADNQPHEVMVESVCETLEKSMHEVATIIGVPQ